MSKEKNEKKKKVCIECGKVQPEFRISNGKELHKNIVAKTNPNDSAKRNEEEKEKVCIHCGKVQPEFRISDGKELNWLHKSILAETNPMDSAKRNKDLLEKKSKGLLFLRTAPFKMPSKEKVKSPDGKYYH